MTIHAVQADEIRRSEEGRRGAQRAAPVVIGISGATRNPAAAVILDAVDRLQFDDTVVLPDGPGNDA